MGKQVFNIKGMMRDISPSKASNQYAYEIRNLRLTAQENSTFLSLTSEKGNIQYTLSSTILGTIVGYCTLGKYLTVFTTEYSGETHTTDHIYRLEESGRTTFTVVTLYSGDLGFTKDIILETKGVYENENIQKVYWIDGVHQPRVLNIVASEATRTSWLTRVAPFDFIPTLGLKEKVRIDKAPYNGLFSPGTIQYILTYYNKNGQQTNAFYSSPLHYVARSSRGVSSEESVSTAFEITIENPDTNFDFVKVYSVQRTSENGTPICRRVGSIKTSTKTGSRQKESLTSIPETIGGVSVTENISSDITLGEFKIFKKLSGSKELDIDKFLISRVGTDSIYHIPYSYIVRGDLSAEQATGNLSYEAYQAQEGKILQLTYNVKTGIAVLGMLDPSSGDTFTKYKYSWYSAVEESYSYLSIIDNGICGETVDYSEILYSGGSSIIPKTFNRKDNTLFFGNYSYPKSLVSDELISLVQANTAINYTYSSNAINKGNSGDLYEYQNQLGLSAEDITTFKGGEVYTFGIILQDSLGSWSSVIPIGSSRNSLYPLDKGDYFYPVKASINMTEGLIATLKTRGVVNVKAVVLDDMNLKDVVCQGVLCPTVFSKKRKDNLPFAQSSWFFRPMNSIQDGMGISNEHHTNIPSFKGTNASLIGDDYVCSGEIYGASSADVNVCEGTAESNGMDMFVDYSILTMNSPDITFERVTSLDNVKMRIVGLLPITSSASTMAISTSTPAKESSINNNRFYPKTIYDNLGDSSASSYYGFRKVQTIFCWFDRAVSSTGTFESSGIYKYPILPWHRQGSLSAQHTPASNDAWFGELNTKVYSSLRASNRTFFMAEDKMLSYDLADAKLYQDDASMLSLTNNEDDLDYNTNKIYSGEVNTILNNTGFNTYFLNPSSSTPERLQHTSNFTTQPVSMKYKSTPHAVCSLQWKKGYQTILPSITTKISPGQQSPIIHGSYSGKSGVPFWSIRSNGTVSTNPFPSYHKAYAITKFTNGTSINNNTVVIDGYNVDELSKISAAGIKLYLHSGINEDSGVCTSFGYMHESLLVNPDPEDEYRVVAFPNWNNYRYTHEKIAYQVPSPHGFSTITKYKYQLVPDKVTNILWIVREKTNNYYKLIPAEPTVSEFIASTDDSWITFILRKASSYELHTRNDRYLYIKASQIFKKTNLTGEQISQDNINAINYYPYKFLYLAEFYKDVAETRDIPINSTWRVAGPSVSLLDTVTKRVVDATYGDTYYQRFDCLKTYPYTLEDQNQVVEIFSFMCETRVNIDGRYDTRRGMIDNTTALNTNFNLLNKGYTQEDNFYTYSYLDDTLLSINSFTSQLIWTKTKIYGDDVDQWTQIIPLSTLDLDGSLGEITSLNLLNDNLICFQDRGISRINYNDKVTLSTEQGVPVELANSGKVDGNTYISTQIGCSNKQSVQVTESGIYFIDSNTREFYKWSQGLEPLSKSKGFNTFFYDKKVELNKIRTFYDPKLKDVYLRMSYSDTRANDCLVYNEQFGEFVGFFDYDADFFLPLQDSLIAVKNNTLWRQFESDDYLSFFGQQKGYSIEITSAENPMAEKIFTNLEFRANTLKQGSTTNTSSYASPNELPFDSIRAYNDYQDSGSVSFDRMLRRGTNMSQKFRIWRADIPRAGKLERIRNPWTKIKLVKNAGKYNTRLDDISVLYF